MLIFAQLGVVQLYFLRTSAKCFLYLLAEINAGTCQGCPEMPIQLFEYFLILTLNSRKQLSHKNY